MAVILMREGQDRVPHPKPCCCEGTSHGPGVLAQHRKMCAESHRAVPRPGLKSCTCQQAQHPADHFRCPRLIYSLTWFSVSVGSAQSRTLR